MEQAAQLGLSAVGVIICECALQTIVRFTPFKEGLSNMVKTSALHFLKGAAGRIEWHLSVRWQKQPTSNYDC